MEKSRIKNLSHLKVKRREEKRIAKSIWLNADQEK